MSAPPSASGERITDRRQLVEDLARGCKPPSAWRIGTEHEKIVFRTADLRPLPYEGETGIRAILEGIAREFRWEPVLEDGRPIALTRNGANVSLEPGGQLELSGAALETLHQTRAETEGHLDEVQAIAGALGAAMLALGSNPKWRREDIPWMPKGRYRIMRDYMPKRGSLGLDMMLRTCTVQVNLDFASEADMVRKYRVSMALQPVATALFANSPFTEGRPNGYLSWRSHIWTDTDPDRSGILPFAFEAGFGFERYVDWLLDVPMYFVYRDGRYIDAAGQSFRDFLAGRLPALPGELPTLSDWADHVTTAFPEVRLKRYLEMRGADSGPRAMLCALPALWTGLLYDAAALDEAVGLVADWSFEDVSALRLAAPKQALRTPFRGGTVRDVAREVLKIARGGLARRARLDADGLDETRYLDPLDAIVADGRTQAEVMLERFFGPWNGDIDHVFQERTL